MRRFLIIVTIAAALQDASTSWADEDLNPPVELTDTYVDTESPLIANYPVGLAAKESLESDDLQRVEEFEFIGSLDPVPDESTVVTQSDCPQQLDFSTTAACGSGAAPSAAKTHVTGRVQEHSNWCGPASVATALSAHNVNPTQTTLAAEMGTAAAGTYANRMPAPMNRRQRYNPYQWSTDVASSEILMERAMLDVWNYASDLVLPGRGSYVPWWQEHGANGYHFFTVYGYYTQHSGGLYVWDPLNTTWAGRHTEPISDAWAAEAHYDLDRGSAAVELVW